MTRGQPHHETERQREDAYEAFRTSIRDKLAAVEPKTETLAMGVSIPIAILSDEDSKAEIVMEADEEEMMAAQAKAAKMGMRITHREAKLRFTDEADCRIAWTQCDAGGYVAETFVADLERSSTERHASQYQASLDGPVLRSDYFKPDMQAVERAMDTIDDPLGKTLAAVMGVYGPLATRQADEAAGLEGHPVLAEEAYALARDIGQAILRAD